MFAAAAVAAGGLVLIVGASWADEGMWTFDNFPAQRVNKEYGTHIDQAWLDRIRQSAVRLSSGCSASVVTGDGLVLTNHHCVRGCAQNLSTSKINYVENGFFTDAQSEEKLCPGMQAEILIGISDVTKRVTDAAAGKTGQAFIKARDAAEAAIEKEGCAGHETEQRCQVIDLYQGGQYKLYVYRKYSDVRLVYAPEQQTAFFGGDPDNFNFPRYDLDFSFVRLYENGKPAATPAHLTWRDTPPKAGEPVFVVGNPGSTNRLFTAAQLESLRDFQIPDTLVMLSELRGRLIRFSEESAEHARIANETLFGVENSFKAYHGEEFTLVSPGFVDTKRRADDALRAKVRANAQLAKEIGDPWADLARAQVAKRSLYYRHTYLEARAGVLSDLFRYGRALVRHAQEVAKPDAERLPEYSESRLPLLQKRTLDPAPVYPEREQLVLEFWLTKLRENLTADAEGTKVFLGKDSPENLAAALSKSRLADPAYRKQLWDGGQAAINASDDPMIRFILRTDPTSRAIRKEYEERVSGPSDRAAAQIAKARFAVYGTSTYPDATFSLRISYGKVVGWREGDHDVAPFTYFGGLWERATGHPPFNLMPKWQAARGHVNDRTVFDFTTDNDIVGGNSGSPAIDADGNVIGAAFDGNIESLGGAFLFDEKVNRSVIVSTAAITEALKNVYHAGWLVKNLHGN